MTGTLLFWRLQMDKQKSIWFAANIESSSRGGIARSIHTLSNHLKENNYNVEIIFSSSKNSNYIIFSLKVLTTYIRSLNKTKPNWVIARSTDAFFLLLFIKLFRLKTGVILYNHGWEPLAYDLEKRIAKQNVDNPTTIKAKILRFPMLNISITLTDYLISGTITETRYLKKRYRRYISKFKYLPNAISLLNIEKSEIKEKLTFLTVANSNWKKNLDYSINLFNMIHKDFPNTKLICAGTLLTNNEFKRKYGITEGIENITSVNPADMDNFYKKSNYFISTSRYEGGHSFAILEAINNRTLVIASSIPSTMEIIKNKRTGVIISGSNLHRDLEIIKDTLSIDDNKIRQNAFNSIKRYSIKRVGPQLERLLA